MLDGLLGLEGEHQALLDWIDGWLEERAA